MNTNTNHNGEENGTVKSFPGDSDKLWLVVRSLKGPDGKMEYKIKKFDVIKLGRVRFKVKDFKFTT